MNRLVSHARTAFPTHLSRMRTGFEMRRLFGGAPASVPMDPVSRLRTSVTALMASLLCSTSAVLALASPTDDPHRITRARFASEEGWFVIWIDTSAPWAHWTLANPARIIVDLGDAITELANAPGLYEASMPEGPIKLLRTSQFMNTPLDRRVRFTFELDKIAVYEARRVGESIEVRIANDQPASSRTWELTAAGLQETTPPARVAMASNPIPETSAPPLQMAAEARTDAPDRADAVDARAGEIDNDSDRPDANSLNEAVDVPPRSRAPSRLLDALATVFDTSRSDANARTESSANLRNETGKNEKIADARDENSANEASADDRNLEQPSNDRPGNRSKEALEEPRDDRPDHPGNRDLGNDGDLNANDEVDPTAGDPADLDEARISLEQLLGSSSIDHVREVQGKMIDDDFPSSAQLETGAIPDSLGMIVEDDYALDQPPEPSDVVRERAARRLLDDAVETWTSGDGARAMALCDRLRRHYPLCPSAQQAIILEREMHLAAGNLALAATLPAYPVLPDSGVIPETGFLRLLDAHWELGQVDQIERLTETWGPLYPGGSWRGSTRFALGEHYYRERDLARAETYLAAIAPEDSLGARALAMRARLRDEAGDKAGALALYEQLSMLGPGPYQLRGLARTADLQFQSGQVDSALAVYREIEASQPDETETPWAIFQIGNCHTILGDREAATEAYERVISSFPQSYWAEAARSQLRSLDWHTDLARQVEGMQRR